MVESVDQSQDLSEALSEGCEIIVCIPVAGHQEGGNIYRTLESYSHQTLSPDQFEINLYVNKPQLDQEGNPVEWDQTFDEIERFKTDHPEMQIVVETEEFRPGEFTIGKVRHHQAKRVLQRSVARDNAEREVILVSNDADNKGVAPTYLKNFLQKFEAQPEASAFLGQIDWNPEEYVQHPLVHIGTRLFQYLNIQSRTKGWFIDSSGANFAIRGSVYAELEGHNVDITKGEDSDLGERLKELKGPNAIQFGGNRASLVYTSARRAVDTVLKGKAPIEQWDDQFGEFDDEVRKIAQGATTTVDFENKDSVKAFLTQVEKLINRSLHKTKDWGGKVSDNIFVNALNWLGIEQYRVIDDWTIEIINAEKLIQNLKAYRTEGPLVQAAKSGDAEAAKILAKHRKELRTAKVEAMLSAIDAPLLVREQYPATAAEILTSEKTITSDRYTLSLSPNHVMSHNAEGKPNAIMGVDREAQAIIVAKRIDPIHEEWFREKSGSASPISAEEMLIGESIKGAPRERISIPEQSDFYIYEKARSDLYAVLDDGRELSLPQAIKLVMDLLENLRLLQSKGVLHADITPKNILIGQEGQAWLTDLQSAPMKTKAGEFNKPYGGGVYEVFPAELIQLESPMHPSVDTYSLLSIFYRLLKGRYPHQIEGISHSKLSEEQLKIIYSALHREEPVDYTDLPPSLVIILKKGLSPNPDDRYEQAADLLQDLGKALTSLDLNELKTAEIQILTESIEEPKAA